LRYHTNALTTTQVLEELIKLAKDIRTARTRGEETASPTRKSRSMTRWPRTNTPHLAHQGKARSKAVLVDLYARVQLGRAAQTPWRIHWWLSALAGVRQRPEPKTRGRIPQRRETGTKSNP